MNLAASKSLIVLLILRMCLSVSIAAEYESPGSLPSNVLNVEISRALVLLSDKNKINDNVFNSLQSFSPEQGGRQLLFDVQQVAEYFEKRPSFDAYQAIITVGTKAARFILDLDLELPVLSVLVPKITFETLLNSKERGKREDSYSVIYLDQPLSREIYLSEKLLRNVKKIGAVLGPYSVQNLPLLQREVKRRKLGLQVVEVDSGNRSNQGIKELVRSSDVLLALPDPIAFTSQRAKWLLYQAYQNRVAVIAFSKAYVDAGALAAVYSTPQQIGAHAREVIKQILENPAATPHAYHPKYFNIAVNNSVAHSLSLDVPDVEKLTRDLQAEERRRD